MVFRAVVEVGGSAVVVVVVVEIVMVVVACVVVDVNNLLVPRSHSYMITEIWLLFVMWQ